MSKPSTKLEFATDGGALLTDPGAAKRHAGFNVDEAIPAHWLNWLFKNVSEWIAFLNLSAADDELTYAAPRSHTRVFSPQGGTGGGLDISNPNERDYGNAGAGVRMQQTADSSGGLSWVKQIHLPEGSVITGWRSMVLVDFFSASGAASVDVQLRKRTPEWNGPSTGNPGSPIGSTTISHTGSNTLSVRGQSGLSETVLPGTQYYLEWTSALGGAALLHVIEAYELTWTETRATGNF